MIKKDGSSKAKIAIKVASGAFIVEKALGDVRDGAGGFKSIFSGFFGGFKKRDVEDREKYPCSVYSPFAGMYRFEKGGDIEYTLDFASDARYAQASLKKAGLNIGGNDISDLMSFVFTDKQILLMKNQANAIKRIYLFGLYIDAMFILYFLILERFFTVFMLLFSVSVLISLAVGRDIYMARLKKKKLIGLAEYFQAAGFFGWLSWGD